MSLITRTSCSFAFLVAGVVAQGPASRITCSSDNGQRVNCNANTRGGVRLVRQLSGSPCQEGSTWGYDSRGIWVDRGCRAEFEIQGGSGGFGAPGNQQGGSQQGEQRRAQIRGNGNSDRGKCTIEVVVDSVAEVEIRGDSAVLRNIAGQTPQWRRFECTGPMPVNPADFRFAGVDGRGRQQLVGDPRTGGVAVVRIEDPQAGSEGYTFDLTWSGGSGYNTGSRDGRGDDRRNEANPDRYGQYGNRNSSNRESMQQCERAIRERIRRDGYESVEVQSMTADNRSSRGDSIVGNARAARGNGFDTFDFSCTLNTNNGSIRSVDVRRR